MTTTPTANPQLTILAASSQGLHVRAVYTKKPLELPGHLVNNPTYEQEFQRLQAKIAAGQAFDGKYHPTVHIEQVDNEFILHVQEFPYSVAAPINKVLKEQFAHNLVVPPLFPVARYRGASSGLDTVVITADNQLLVTKRSTNVGKWPGYWAIVFGESIDTSDINTWTIATGSLRCLKEELAIDLSPEAVDNVRILMLARDNEYLSWTVFAVMDFRGQDLAKYSAEALLLQARQASDAWEHSQLEAVPIDQIKTFFEDKLVLPATKPLLAILEPLF